MQNYDNASDGLLVWFRFMVFNATFNNIPVISWLTTLVVIGTDFTWAFGPVYIYCSFKYSDFGGGKKKNLIQSFCRIT